MGSGKSCRHQRDAERTASAALPRMRKALELSLVGDVGASYLQVSGVDMDGVHVGHLRLWNHEEGDVEAESRS